MCSSTLNVSDDTIQDPTECHDMFDTEMLRIPIHIDASTAGITQFNAKGGD